MSAPSAISTTPTSSDTTAQGSFAVTLPSYVAGNLVILDVGTIKTVAGTITVSAAGWSQYDSHINGTSQKFVLYRIMDGSEGSSVTLTSAGSNPSDTRWRVNATSYQGMSAASPFDGGSAVKNNGSTSAASTGSFATSGPDRLALGMFQNSSGLVVTFAATTGGVVERYENGSLNASVNESGEELVESAAGSYSIDGNWSQSATWLSMAVILAPPSTAATVSVLTPPPVRGLR